MSTARPRRIWLVFGICVLSVLAVLGWATVSLLRLEAAERAARQEADLQERIRVALWRMDSIIAPRLAEEAARPYFHYAAFYAPQRAYTRMLSPLVPGEVLVPSPLLMFSDPFLKLHFQVDAAGRVSSPQAPTGNLRDIAEASYSSPRDVAAASALLDTFTATGPRGLAPTTDEVQMQISRQQDSNEMIISNASRLRDTGSIQIAQSAQEWGNRQQSLENFQQRGIAQQKVQIETSAAGSGEPGVTVSQFAPLWHRDGKQGVSLVFVRHVSVGEAELTQGIWADWPAIRQALLDAVRDLLPDAALDPTDAPEKANPGTLLASIPAVLNPGRAGAPAAGPVSLMRAVLALAWLVTLAAVGTVGTVLRAAVDLSRRRGEFVSAVTHELRTPLTTFRMYSDMLAEGMVSDETARQEYLATLRDESDHLSRVVENVLTYARVEQGRSMATRRERMTADDLIATATARAAERARHAGAVLTIDIPNGCGGGESGPNGSHADDPSASEPPGVAGDRQPSHAARSGQARADGNPPPAPVALPSGAAADRQRSDMASLVVETDPGAVEQIIGNLIDNAIKYACPTDPRIEIRISHDAASNMLCLFVGDHGPGINRKDAEAIFQPFVRGSRQDGSVQGVGLGLAISRQLARDLGGDLRVHGRDGGGAEFAVTLPISEE